MLAHRKGMEARVKIAGVKEVREMEVRISIARVTARLTKEIIN